MMVILIKKLDNMIIKIWIKKYEWEQEFLNNSKTLFPKQDQIYQEQLNR